MWNAGMRVCEAKSDAAADALRGVEEEEAMSDDLPPTLAERVTMLESCVEQLQRYVGQLLAERRYWQEHVPGDRPLDEQRTTH
jgi:hypothetical protein